MLQFLGLDETAPCLLLFVESLFPRHPLGPFHSARGERQHLVGASLRPLCLVLPDEPPSNHAIHGPTRRVGLSIEVGFGQVAVGDTAIHSHVGHRPIHAALESLALRARIVLAPVAAALSLLPLFRVVSPGASYGTGPGIGG